MVSAWVVTHPTTGQRRISDLAMKPIMCCECSAMMSTQLTWLATNKVPPGSGVPTRCTRIPNTRSSPPAHQRTMPCDSGPPLPMAISSRVSGRWIRTCQANSGRRYR